MKVNEKNLPQLSESKLEFQFEMSKQNQFESPKYAHPWFGSIILFLSVLGGSALGVISNQLPADGPLLKNCWRFQALILVSIFMIPFFYLYDRFYLKIQRYRAYLNEIQQLNLKPNQTNEIQQVISQENFKSGRSYEEKYPRNSESSLNNTITNERILEQFEVMDKDSFRKTLSQTFSAISDSIQQASKNNLALFDIEAKIGKRTFIKNVYFLSLFSCLMFCVWTALSIWGSVHTLQSHSYALSNLHGILIIPVLIVQKRHVHQLEKYGCFLILLACVGIMFDRWSHRKDQIIISGKKTKIISNFYTDLYLLLSNIPACLYFALNRSIMRFGILKHLIIQNILIAFLFTVGAILFENANMDLNLNHGIFGWLNAQVSFECIFFLGFFSTFFGSLGYIISMQFIPPQICLNAYLLEPFFSQVLGCLFGIDEIPSAVSIIGVLAITFGTILVNKGTFTMIREGRRILPDLEELEKERLNKQSDGSGIIMKQIEKMEQKVKEMKQNQKQLENKELLSRGNKFSEDFSNQDMLQTKGSDIYGPSGNRAASNYDDFNQLQFSKIISPSLNEA